MFVFNLWSPVCVEVSWCPLWFLCCVDVWYSAMQIKYIWIWSRESDRQETSLCFSLQAVLTFNYVQPTTFTWHKLFIPSTNCMWVCGWLRVCVYTLVPFLLCLHVWIHLKLTAHLYLSVLVQLSLSVQPIFLLCCDLKTAVNSECFKAQSE